jgi:predicted MFS family arabinose efflux permease
MAEATETASRGSQPESPWSPLRSPLFRAIWIASVASNLGTWMHLVAASWVMTDLTASAALVALVQTATAVPIFVLALPAGALADVLDRRRMIIAAQLWQLVAASALGAITLADAVTPASLLALTVALGTGAALSVPAFGASIPELVPRRQLPAAVSLNSFSFTLAQGAGPAIGGLIVAELGAGAVFLFNGASFLAVTLAVAAWRRPPDASGLPAEHVVAAVRTGARYVMNAVPLQVVLARLASHVLFFSAVPALLVVVARAELELGAAAYGALFGCLGAGGALGALLVPRVRPRLGTDRLVAIGAAALAAGAFALAAMRTPAPLYPLMLVAGAGSLTVLSSLMVAAQSVLPSWVRGRGLATYMLTFQAAMAGGAALWGAVAAAAGPSVALTAAGAGVLLVPLVSWATGLRLRAADQVDLTPAGWTEPQLAFEPSPSEGPVLVEIEYRIAAEDAGEFVSAMRELRRTRRRDGAMRWSLFQDLSDPERHVESFLVSSWAEHERAHERGVRSDRAAVERVLRLHRGEPPRVTHLLGHDLRARKHNLTPPEGLA